MSAVPGMLNSQPPSHRPAGLQGRRAAGDVATLQRGKAAVVASAEEVYKLYTEDRLVIHSIPTWMVGQRPGCFKDSTTLMCGSLLFYRGLRHRPTGHQVASGVARFGDAERVHATVFASLHDLERVWESHARLEASKPPRCRHPDGPFVYFAHHDMADAAEVMGGQPPESYCDCHPGGPGPAAFIRTRGFDFRDHCESQPPPHLPPDAEARGVQWNELRAALSYDNMVGLAYIHDPSRDPRQHLEEAEGLRRAVARSAQEARQEGRRRSCCGPRSDTTSADVAGPGPGPGGGPDPEDKASCAEPRSPSQQRQQQHQPPQQQDQDQDLELPASSQSVGQHASQQQQAHTEQQQQQQQPGQGQGAGQGGQEEEEEDGLPRLEIFVFALEQSSGVNGHLLVVEEEAEEVAEGRWAGAAGLKERGAEEAPGSWVPRRRGRAVTLEEYVVALERSPAGSAAAAGLQAAPSGGG